ncbi:MAG TPA: metalloregulator ArsR/SmtB family transcription factor [Candidatus Cybelea sp.]|nr:metalloregulator ArsR/SmtB family transcription factor [Candidatus Cybelea sp.]
MTKDAKPIHSIHLLNDLMSALDMSRVGPKQVLYAQFAEVAKALGHGHRLEILELLAQGERSVEALAERAGLSIANASQHLRLMRQAGLLASRRDGKHILYRLSDPAVLDLVAALHRVGERNLAEVRELVGGYFHQRDALEPVSREELVRRLKADLVTVLDVRPEDEFAAGHLPQAVNIPLRDLARRLRGLPKSREIVAYCRGPYCVLAFEAVALLRKHGFKVRRLEDGFPEWKAEGLPIQ